LHPWRTFQRIQLPVMIAGKAGAGKFVMVIVLVLVLLAFLFFFAWFRQRKRPVPEPSLHAAIYVRRSELPVFLFALALCMILS